TALTLQVAVSTVIAAALVALSGLIAHFYATPGLSFFLFLAAIAGLIEALAQPVVALLRREMSFGALAIIRTVVSLVTALVTIVLAAVSFDPASFAWGTLAAAAARAAPALACSPVPAAATLPP